MDRPRGPLTRRQLGVIVSIIGVITFVALGVRTLSKRPFVEKVEIRSDFRTVTGLRQGSPVQLAGVDVGSVSRIDFINRRYECDPLTEDVGRFGHGRTDDCDDFLFCSPVGLCGDLEPWAGRGEHTQCSSSEECREDEICVTGEFRRRERRVPWSGIHGVCARYNTEHIRVQVKMRIEKDKLELIRTDSRATVASNSVLGDQLVNISPGHGDELTGNLRIQSSPSLHEDIERFRQRIVRFLDTAEVALEAINSVLDELRDERTIDDIKGTVAHLEIVTAHVAEQRGLVGALIGAPEYRRDFGLTLRALRNTGEGLEEMVRRANGLLATFDRNFEPFVEDSRGALAALDQLLQDLRDPDNRSLMAKLLYDEEGDLAENTEALLHNTAELTGSTRQIGEAIDDGDGTLGLLIADPTLTEDVGKLLHNLARNDLVRSLALWYLERQGSIDMEGSRAPAGDPRVRRKRRRGP